MNLQLLIANVLMIILPLIGTTETTDTSHSVYGAQDWRTQYIPTYEAWRTKYHKETYNSRRHSRKSFSAWVTNFIEIREHNYRYERGMELYRKEANKFTDKWPTILLQALMPSTRVYNFYRGLTPIQLLPVEVPTNVNWAKKDWTSKYKRGATFATGWIFSAVKSVEYQLFKATGVFRKLSRQEVADCIENPPRLHYSTDAFEYIKEHGVTIEIDYPMGNGTPGDCLHNGRNRNFKIRDYRLLKPGDEENLKLAVALIGPVSISIKVTEDFFFYQEGIFYHPTYENDNCTVNHSVLLVGYGTDIRDGDFWIILNSFGNGWGDQGFAKLARNTVNDCGVALAAVVPDITYKL